MYMDPIYNFDSTMAQQQAQELATEECTNGMEAQKEKEATRLRPKDKRVKNPPS